MGIPLTCSSRAKTARPLASWPVTTWRTCIPRLHSRPVCSWSGSPRRSDAIPSRKATHQVVDLGELHGASPQEVADCCCRSALGLTDLDQVAVGVTQVAADLRSAVDRRGEE